MEYKIKIAPEYDDFYTWNKLYRDRIMHSFTSMTKMLLILCALVLVVCAVLLVVYKSFSWVFIVIVAVYAAFAYYFFSAYKLYTKWGMKLYERRGFSEATFNDNGIVCKYAEKEKTVPYSSIGTIFESERCFYLMPHRNFVIILSKSNIENPDAFSAFLSEKTHLNAQIIN